MSVVRVFFALAILAIATTTPAQAAAGIDPVAIAKTTADGTVSIIAATDGPPAGTILPVCESNTEEPEPNKTILGTIANNCFQPLGGCEIIITGVNLDYTPPKVVANPDWRCIEDRIESLLGQPATNILFLLRIES